MLNLLFILSQKKKKKTQKTELNEISCIFQFQHSLGIQEVIVFFKTQHMYTLWKYKKMQNYLNIFMRFKAQKLQKVAFIDVCHILEFLAISITFKIIFIRICSWLRLLLLT